MKALRIPKGDGGRPSWLSNTGLTPDGSYSEKWLQEFLFNHPDILPLEEIDPGVSEIIPICRELPLPKETRTVFLDILAVTPHGRLVLVECKLWRNPQARREVIGQLLEYAALLQAWSYGDLTARLKSKLGWKGKNPLYDHAARIHGVLDEARFVDAVSRSLRRGDFDLIIAGDGIRSDVQTIATFLHMEKNSDDTEDVIQALKEQSDEIEREIGLQVEIGDRGVGHHYPAPPESETEQQQMQRLREGTNKFVTAFRPRLAALEKARSSSS